MDSEPLVSILMPTFNRAHLLPGSIGSVLAQDYTNWELIVWDDGSTDNTHHVVESFSDERVRYFWGKNSGQSHALNQALAVAEGQYIAFLDDDDQWTEQKLAVQVRILERFKDIELLFGDFVNVNLSTGEKILCFEQNDVGLQRLIIEEVAANVFAIRRGMPESMLKANFIGFDTVIVRKQILMALGGFNEQLRNSNDVELWWRMGLAGGRFGYISEVVMKRFKYPGSLSSSSITMYQNHIKCLDFILCHTLANNRRDLVPAINAAYHRAWLGMSREYSLLGKKSCAARALARATKYGFSRGACYEFLGILVGRRAARQVRGLARRTKRLREQ